VLGLGLQLGFGVRVRVARGQTFGEGQMSYMFVRRPTQHHGHHASVDVRPPTRHQPQILRSSFSCLSFPKTDRDREGGTIGQEVDATLLMLCVVRYTTNSAVVGYLSVCSSSAECICDTVSSLLTTDDNPSAVGL